MQALPMASCNKKRCNHRKRKRGIKKYENTQNFVFASKQFRITRLLKYPIDPKAYLGRCTLMVFMVIFLYNSFVKFHGKKV